MKTRLDEAIVSLGLATTRSQAKQLIIGGKVLHNNLPADKVGKLVNLEDDIVVTTKDNYVSRGALKLKRALKDFNISVQNFVIADIGASTGGFTDLLLQNGAKKAYCIDVGHGQLAEKLRHDQRVINIEGQNIRELKSLPEAIDLAVIDLSYISLRLVMEKILSLLKPHGQAIALFKPQFEVGPKVVNREGVVKDPEVAQKALEDFIVWAATEKINILQHTVSPIAGKRGNKEFLLLIAQH